MKFYGSRFCRQCRTLFQLAEPDGQLCPSCEQPAEPVVTVTAPGAPGPSPAEPAPVRPVRDARKRKRVKRAAAGRNAGPVTGPRTLPMLRALAAAPDGLTTPQLAEYASASASWVNALGSVRQLMLKQERQGRVRQAGTVAGDRTRGSVLWRITEEGERYVRDASGGEGGSTTARDSS